MIRYEYLNFLKDWQDNFPENLQFVVSLQSGYWLIARNYIFEVVAIDNPTPGEFSNIEVKDKNNNHFIIGNYVDDYLKVGNKILVPTAITSYNEIISLKTPIGYTLARDDCELSSISIVNEYVPDNTYIHSLYKNNRGGFIITDPEGLPDVFWDVFPDMIHLKPRIPETVQEYIDNIKLLNYDAKYPLFDELENEQVKPNYNKKPQSFDSRQSKIYIMSKDMKQILKKTSVMLINHKAKYFDMDAMVIRNLENEKIFALLKEMGLDKKDVSFARKEIGAIRAIIDVGKEVIVKARFVEINIDDHQDKSDIRYLQNGEQIEYNQSKGNWYFLNEL